MTDWAKWESQVINGVFPLRRFLGRSNHSVVFLTEYKVHNLPTAAIKIVPADPLQEDAQLSHWRAVAALSHPHLIRLLDFGRCQLGGHKFLFVVMEYAEQTLAQILPHRSLTPEEAREMLLPTLEVLTFLHRRNLVQGQLKPPNFLVVGDQLKISSDTVHPAGAFSPSLGKSSVYDAPESKSGTISAASDIWGLGVTLVEALTQHLPTWPDERSETAFLPAALPSAFVDIVRRCLSRNPANRPTIAALLARIKSAPDTVAPAPSPAPQNAVAPLPSPASPDAVPQPVANEAADTAAASPRSAIPRQFMLASAVGLLMLVAIWAGLRPFKSLPTPRRPDSSTISQLSSQPPAPAVASPLPALPPETSQNPRIAVSAPNAVLHEEIPEVSRSARASIRGRIKVTVRVAVDRSGRVVKETLEYSGSSRYFAHLASEAARKWRFAPAENPDSRVWLLQFEFTRGGAIGHAVPRA